MYINRVKQYHTRSVQYEQILKKNEQMYALLAMTVALSPASQKVLDENVTTQLRERNAEKMAKMVRHEKVLSRAGSWLSCHIPILNTPTAFLHDSSSLVFAGARRCGSL